MSPPSTLGQRYAAECHARGYQPDAAQRAAVDQLERLRVALISGGGQRSWWRWPRHPAAPGGLYLYGPVGRGKTWLMDLFFDSLPFAGRQRSHFHHFMRDIHARLRRLNRRRAPLEAVAGNLARHCRVLCLDELFISDIADAMILGTLFASLLRNHVALVITSNAAPAELYLDGLQRSRFLPAIALLEQALTPCRLDGGADYRLRQLQRGSIYLDSAAPDSVARMRALFGELAGERGAWLGALQLLGRTVPVVAARADVAWFEFAIICESSRSQNDYVELAGEYRTVMISHIPRFQTPAQDDAARRLIALVDVFYDQGTKLVVSAAAAPFDLYRSGRLCTEFERTASRLTEMQTPAYLARARRG